MRVLAVMGISGLLGCSSLLGLSEEEGQASAGASSGASTSGESSSGASTSGASSSGASSSGATPPGSSSSSGSSGVSPGACLEGFVGAPPQCEDGRTWSHESEEQAANPDYGDRFGESLAVSADGTTMVVGATRESSPATTVGGDTSNDENGPGSGSGAAYVFAKEGGAWVQQAYVKPSDSVRFGSFGTAVALSADGNTMLASSWVNEVSVNGSVVTPARALVFVFVRTGSAWRELQILRGEATQKDQFGRALAVSGDGKVLAVGAAFGPGAGGATGLVHVFRGNQDGFTLATKITQPYSNTFGSAVALSHDGSSLLVGDPGEDSAGAGLGVVPADDGVQMSGAVSLFTESGGGYQPVGFFKASNAAQSARFGNVVALAADGRRFAVGAVNESSASPGGGAPLNRSGAAYVFSNDGASWRESFLKAPNARTELAFGTSLALSANGSTLLVGAPNDSSNASDVGGNMSDDRAPGRGAAYVFSPDGAGTWTHRAYLKPSTTGVDFEFGRSVGLSGTGAAAMVGARDEGRLLPYGSVNVFAGTIPTAIDGGAP